MQDCELLLRDPCKYCRKVHLDYACDEQIKQITKIRKVVKWRIPEIRIFDMYIEDDSGWFRLFGGGGLAWKNINKHKLTFTERQGLTKFIRIGRYLIKALKD